MKTKPILLIALMAVSCLYGFAQNASNNATSLTIEKIMQHPEEWIGALPENIFWDETSESILFDRNNSTDTLTPLCKYSIHTGKTEEIPYKEQINLPGARGVCSSDRTLKLYTGNNNLFLIDLSKTETRQLTSWPGRISSYGFCNNGKDVWFLKDQNLFKFNLKTGTIIQLATFHEGDNNKENTAGNDQDKWLSAQQEELFDFIKATRAVEKAREKEKQIVESAGPVKIYLGKKKLYHASLSPSGDYVAYTSYESKQSKNTSVTHWITGSGYTLEKNARPKVGSPETTVELKIYNLKNNKQISVSCNAVPGLKDQPGWMTDYAEKYNSDSTKVKDRMVNVLDPVWNDAGDKALVEVLSHDNKDRWIMLLDPETGSMRLVDRQHDEAWIGGPGIGGWSISDGKAGWFPDNKTVWFQSEESGYSHLYKANTETLDKKAITSGPFEVSDVVLSNDKKNFYLTANKIHPGVRHFYRVSADGGNLVQLTSMEGNNEVTLSPDEKHLAIRHSFANKPWELYLQENKPGAAPLQITRSTTKEFDRYNWRVPEFVTFTAKDGTTVYARLYRPDKPEKQGPAVVFVHGAGYLQNAHKWWSQYEKEYMFHNFLADNGYTVLDIDYRGSAGYGRNWRTGIYRHMGGKDLSDHIDGAEYLVKHCDISPDRIGIYGGSYGGFITLMAMFTRPGTFAAGAALRSVTDWAHYNHGYTSNILNIPADDSLAYTKSSPIYHAGGLEGALLMCHGMVDDNVQFQDIVRLTQRLIELGKENWELAVYPVEAHSFTQPSSWIDEYKRIYKLFEENLKKP